MADNRYPNMSYCMFENTSLAMGQLMDHMREALEGGAPEIHEFMNDLNREERVAFQTVYDMCREYMDLAEEMQDIMDNEPAPDEGDDEDLVVE